MQQRQLQLESDLCAAKNEAAAASAAGDVLIAQLSSANKFQQQLQVEQQDLQQKLGKAEAAAAAAVAAAAARESVVKMFDFEKFVEVWREVYGSMCDVWYLTRCAGKAGDSHCQGRG